MFAFLSFAFLLACRSNGAKVKHHGSIEAMQSPSAPMPLLPGQKWVFYSGYDATSFCNLTTGIPTSTTEQGTEWKISPDAPYFSFRIPSLVYQKPTSGPGVLLAFAEGRYIQPCDLCKSDIVMKRSEDNGQTWSKLQVIAGNQSNNYKFGQPVAVVVNNFSVLFYNNITQDDKNGFILMTNSSDQGKSWSKPIRIIPIDNTSGKPKPQTLKMLLGPTHATFLPPSPFSNYSKGRIIVPYYSNKMSGSGVFYSDDEGATYKMGGAVNDTSAGEVSATYFTATPGDGNPLVVLSYRVAISPKPQNGTCRQMAISYDGGLTFKTFSTGTGDMTGGSFGCWEDVSGVNDPVCGGSILGLADGRLVASGPSRPGRRMDEALYFSRLPMGADGLPAKQAWNKTLVFGLGSYTAYSDIVEFPDKKMIGVVAENGIFTDGQCTQYSVSYANVTIPPS